MSSYMSVTSAHLNVRKVGAFATYDLEHRSMYAANSMRRKFAASKAQETDKKFSQTSHIHKVSPQAARPSSMICPPTLQIWGPEMKRVGKRADVWTGGHSACEDARTKSLQAETPTRCAGLSSPPFSPDSLRLGSDLQTAACSGKYKDRPGERLGKNPASPLPTRSHPENPCERLTQQGEALTAKASTAEAVSTMPSKGLTGSIGKFGTDEIPEVQLASLVTNGLHCSCKLSLAQGKRRRGNGLVASRPSGGRYMTKQAS